MFKDCFGFFVFFVNIYGIHLDRRAAMDSVNLLMEELKSHNVEVVFNNMNATDADKRKVVINELKSFGDIRVKILMHSLAFGTLRPLIDDEVKNTIQQKQIEMTLDVMANSIIYWSQDLFQSLLCWPGVTRHTFLYPLDMARSRSHKGRSRVWG